MPRSSNPVPQYFTGQNKILVGGLMFYFKAGTNDPKSTFANQEETIKNTHPVVLDAEGRLPNVFFSGTAKQVLKDLNDVQIWERDDVGGTGASNFNDTDFQFFSTTQNMIDNFDKTPEINDIVETLGFNVGGDGGGAQWMFTGLIGQTASQTPTDLSANLLNDLNGNQWALVVGQVSDFSGTQWYPLPFGEQGDGGYLYSTLGWERVPELNFTDNGAVDGRFDFWFEGVSSSADGFNTATMWRNSHFGSTKTNTRETLVLGVDIPDIPTAEFYSRTVVVAGAGVSDEVKIVQRIEGVRTFAGQTINFQFRARVDSAKDISINLSQIFGTGGSPSATVSGAVKKFNITTSFALYEFTATIPSIAGKTLGTNGDDALSLTIYFDAGSNLDTATDSLGHQSGTFDIACVQIKKGTQATHFEEKGMQEALALVNRYYFELVGTRSLYRATNTDANRRYYASLPVVQRADPSVTVNTNFGTPNADGNVDTIGVYVDDAPSNELVITTYISDARL